MRQRLRLVTRWLTTHPVAAFLLLSTGISYLLGFPALMAYSAWAPPQPPAVRTYVSRMVVVYGPGIAAMLLTMLTGGRPAASALVRRLVPRPADLPWTLGILVAGAVSSFAAFAFAGVPASQVAGAIDSARLLLLTHFILQILVVSVGEELGWRGWLLPRLMERHTPLRATFLTAVAWGLWHGPLLLAAPLTTALFLSAVAGLSCLFTWIWAHAGQRLFLIVLAHATVNTPIFFWEDLSAPGSHPAAALSAWLALQVMYVIAGCGLVLVTRKWWTRRPTSSYTPSG